MRRFVLEAKAAAALNHPNIELTHRHANVPPATRKSGNVCTVIRCMHVDFSSVVFVSCENKGAVILIPKLKVAGSSLVARSIFSAIKSQSLIPDRFQITTVPQNVPQILAA